MHHNLPSKKILKNKTFSERVLLIVSSIPNGKVLTYGAVAALAHSPRSARQVGFTLARLGGNEKRIPWWRVVNKKGYLSIRGKLYDAKEMQKELLLGEGVKVNEKYELDLKEYGWDIFIKD